MFVCLILGVYCICMYVCIILMCVCLLNSLANVINIRNSYLKDFCTAQKYATTHAHTYTYRCIYIHTFVNSCIRVYSCGFSPARRKSSWMSSLMSVYQTLISHSTPHSKPTIYYGQLHWNFMPHTYIHTHPYMHI